MTSSEDLLRNVLDDLAPGAPADERAYAGVGRAINRRRRRRTAVRVAGIAAAALVALGTAALVDGGRDDVGTVDQPDVTTAPEDARGPDPGTEPGGGADPEATPDNGPAVVEGTVTSIGPASFVLPEAWEADPDERFWTGPDGTEHPYSHLCLRDPAAPREPYCDVEVFHGEAPGAEGFGPYEPEGDWSWWHATDVMICPNGAEPVDYDDIVVPVDGDYGPAATATRTIGGRDAAYSRWDVECIKSGATFSPQAWFLSDEQILLIDIVGQEETEAILDSFNFGGDAG